MIKKHYYILCFLLCLALILRLIAAYSSDLGLDEGLTLIISQWPLKDAFWFPTDPTPFLYYTLHKTFLSADMPAGSIRLISVLSGLGSVALMYCFGKKVGGPALGLTSAFLLAIWFPHIKISANARAYSLLFFFTLAMAYTLYVYLDSFKSRDKSNNGISYESSFWLLLYALSNVFAFYTHLISIFWIASLNLLLCAYLLKQGSRKDYNNVFICFFLMAVCALPGVYRIWLQTKIGHGFNWLDQANFVEFLVGQSNAYLPLGLWENIWVASWIGWKASIYALGIFGIVFLLLFLKTYKAIWSYYKDTPLIFFMIFLFILNPVIIWLSGYFIQPLYMPRVIIYCLPGFLMLLAIALNSLPQAQQLFSVSLIGIICAAAFLLGQLGSTKNDWSGATRILEKNASQQDIVLLDDQYLYPLLRHTVKQEISAPLLAISGDGFILLEETLGKNDAWIKIAFKQRAENSAVSQLKNNTNKPFLYPQFSTEALIGKEIYHISSCLQPFNKEVYKNLNLKVVGRDVFWQDEMRCLKVHKYSITR